jgi:flagellar hook-associated protein 2
MANAIDGLGTINVSQLVTQLMSVEGGQQRLLTTKQSGEKSALTALQALNTQMLAIKSASESIIGSVLAPQAWSNQTVSSSSATVAATATSAASTGQLTFDVTSVAATHRVLLGGAVSSTQPLANGPLTVTRADGTTATIDLSTATTISELAAAINAPGSLLGIRAVAVQVGDNSYRLSLAATRSGASGAFTFSGLDPALGSGAVVSQGTDATIKIGPADTDIVRSATNTFTGVVPGVSFTVSKPETGVTLDVGRNTSAMTGQVKSVVDSVNTLLGTISSKSSYDATTKTGGPLLGERLPTQLSSAISQATLGGGSLADYGIQLDRYGKLQFDSTVFQQKLAADPTGTNAAITAFATRIGQVARDATTYGSGSLSTAIQNRQTTITNLGRSITDWDGRLARKKAQLTSQFSALNTQLSKMNDQATWLSSQLSKLSTPSSSSN